MKLLTATNNTSNVNFYAKKYSMFATLQKQRNFSIATEGNMQKLGEFGWYFRAAWPNPPSSSSQQTAKKINLKSHVLKGACS